ncbi:hypothetical protein DEU56DRAFT_942506 [Suillus clintonianus]|uniref:uncharacterized protein n=1 Tax=Suillus clintonianus TaxID=1904413 RepID=UPI001B86A244|nr:uncharacterized protein DEU56DRAFT_942506 [Suillus clintonianus]KAG2139748.1 hypothetical protein DEU56DRAFT_942506 [Suillus clintonianus]
MAPTSTLMLLSAVHSTTILSGPFVTPSTTPPPGTTVLTYDLWKGGLVCFAVAIVSVVGYFYRRRRKDTISKPKLPGIMLPTILPRDSSVLCSPSDTPYDTSLSCDRSVLQSGSNQLVKHVASTCSVEVVPMVKTGTAEINLINQLRVGKYGEVDVTEADCDCGVQLSVPTIAITVADEDFVSPLSFQSALGLFDKNEDGPKHEEFDDDISIYSSESADASLHDSLLSETAGQHVNVTVPEITCEYYMTVVACEWPARSYNFDISVVGTTLRGGAFLALPGSLPSPSTLPAGPRSPDDRRHGLVEMSELANALAIQLDPPSLDILLRASDMSSVAPIARRHGHVDFSKYADVLNAESGFPLRCHRSLVETHLFGEEEDYQEINSRLMDDLLQSIDEEVEFYNSFICDDECDGISDDTCSAWKHASPTRDYLDFEDDTRAFNAHEDNNLPLQVNGCNEQLSSTPDYPESLGDEEQIFLGSSEGCVLRSCSKQGEYGSDDKLTSDLQQLSAVESETYLNHVSGGTSESAILDLIRLLDEQTVHHQQPVHDSIPEVNSDGFDLLRFVNEDLRLSTDDKYPIVDFDCDDDCEDDNYPRFVATASDSKSSLSETEDESIDDYDSAPSLASASDIDSEDEEVIIAPMTGHTSTSPFLSGSNHRRSPAGCFFVTPATPTRCGYLIDACPCINVTDGEPRTRSFCESFVEVPFTDECWSGIPLDVSLAYMGLSKLDPDLRFSGNTITPQNLVSRSRSSSGTGSTGRSIKGISRSLDLHISTIDFTSQFQP